MKIITIVTCLLVGSTIHTKAQNTKQIKTKISKNEYEVYHVLALDRSVKHGAYELYENKSLKLSGYYKNSKKDSLWIENNGIEKKTAKGCYKDGKRIGIWEFYYEKRLAQKFDFEQNKLIIVDTTGIDPEIIGGKYGGLIYFDQEPVYGDGPDDLMKFLGENLIYPSVAREKYIQGIVFLQSVIDENGKLGDIKVLKGVNSLLEEEAIRVFAMTSGNWKPGVFEGENVAVPVILPVSFRLR